MQTLPQKLDFTLRAALPPIMTLFFILFAAMPMSWAFLSDLVTPLAFASVCFWVIYTPEIFGARWSFFFGLIQDVLAGGVFGVTALAYLLAERVLRHQPPHLLQQSFGIFWLLYALLAVCAGLIQWGAASLLLRDFAAIEPVTLRAALGIGIFPGVVFILSQFQRAFIGRI